MAKPARISLRRRRGCMAPLLAGLLALAPLPAPAELSGLAFVQDDGSLRIRGRTVHLWGIHIPPTHTDCRSFERPVTCGSRAALALDFEIAGFVRCREQGRREDGAMLARCFANGGKFDEGTDLAAFLLSRGWAVAAREAPPDYHVLERVARATGLGIWGLPRVVRP